MLKRLEMCNFRKVESDVMLFSEGLNTIRGPNESSKSTRIEAICYAWFGTTGLKEALDDVVTYGKPVSTLKVCLDFEISGVNYSIKRSKSGAELTHPTGTVTGQKEVTRFVEGLLGCTADVAVKLLLAKQESVKGALTEGATGAVKLIEVLSNFDLIDNILQLIEANLPCGNTKVTEARIEQLKTDAAEILADDITGLEKTLAEAIAVRDVAATAMGNAKASLGELDIDEATRIVNDHATTVARLKDAQTQLETINYGLGLPLPAKPDATQLDVLRKKQADANAAVKSVKLYKQFLEAKVEAEWEGDFASLSSEVAKVKTDEQQLAKALAEDRLELRTLEGKLIKETSCALCGKDLEDVPEVVVINNALSPKIEALQVRIKASEVLLAGACSDLTDLNLVVKHGDAADKLYASCGELVTVDRNTVPAVATWVGPTECDETVYSTQISALEKLIKDYDKAVATETLLKSQKVRQQEAIASLEKHMTELQVTDAKETLVLADERKLDLSNKTTTVTDLTRRVAGAQSALGQARAVLTEATRRIDGAKANLKQAEADLEEMMMNNVLVKKLRGARPQIADKLWTIVLASVSHYFSEMRGVASVVTRAENGFKVNGQSVVGLSGSTLDILGLAIRVALTRTFLQNAPFLVLDEPAAGCDAEREMAMLGLLTACEFQQTLLITHSDLSDAYAAKIITLGE